MGQLGKRVYNPPQDSILPHWAFHESLAGGTPINNRPGGLSYDYFLASFRLIVAFFCELNELRVFGPLEAPWKSALSS